MSEFNSTVEKSGTSRKRFREVGESIAPANKTGKNPKLA
jgi:hypothetical protein